MKNPNVDLKAVARNNGLEKESMFYKLYRLTYCLSIIIDFIILLSIFLIFIKALKLFFQGLIFFFMNKSI